VTTRDRTILVVLGVAAVIAATWLLVVSPKRDQASKLGDQIKTEQAQLTTAQGQVAAGEAARQAYATSYTSLVRLGEAVPADDNVPSLIYQIQGAAHAARVDFRSLQLSGSSSASAPPATSTGSTPTSTAPPPPGATAGPAGFPIEPFSFSFRGNFFHLANFLGRLEHFVSATNKRVSVSGRLMTLDAITLQAGPSGFPQIDASISATTFIVPAAQGLTNGATPASPAPGSSTQQVSTPATSSPAPAAVVASPVR
jgi:hypothetical protein